MIEREGVWCAETLHPDYAQSFREQAVLHDSHTAHQRLRLIQNGRFGRVLTLDGVVQLTEADEFIYHEMLTHVPILAHGGVRRLLVIGGGDGGIAREALRHGGVDVTLVEIDAGVIDFCRTHLPGVSAGAFDDPRLTVVIGDGAAFVRDTDQRFDVIVTDSTDPHGPGAALFSATYYANLARCLAPGGIVVTQNGVPFLQPQELAATMAAFRALFADATCYLAGVPSYVGGPMALGWGTDGAARQTPWAELDRRWRAAGLATRYYTPEVHQAAFALPGYVRQAMG